LPRPSGPRPPAGHAALNEYLTWIVCCHEAAHAVAAYRLRFPCRSIIVDLPIVDGILGEPHLERDHDAVVIGRAYLDGLGKNQTNSILFDCVVSDIAWAVNRYLNDVPPVEADRYAADDGNSNAELFESNGVDPATVNWFREQSSYNCQHLVRLADFRAAVFAVADALIANGGRLEYAQWTGVIEATVGSRLRNSTPAPRHEDIELAAYYLSLKPERTNDPVGNWLRARTKLSVTNEEGEGMIRE